MSTNLVDNALGTARSDGLAAQLTRSLLKKAGNRLKEVVVRVDDERIVIQGRACTYYCLQLVLSSIRAALCESCERVASIELTTDLLKQRGTFQAVCMRSRHIGRPEARPWQLIA